MPRSIWNIRSYFDSYKRTLLPGDNQMFGFIQLMTFPFFNNPIIKFDHKNIYFKINDQFMAIGKAINLKTCVIVGGMDMVTQGLELSKHPHIVVATPGRLADHLESCNTFSLRKIQFLVLDEADRLLSGPFDDQLKIIFNALPKQKQVLFFSATMTDALEKVKEMTSNKVILLDQKIN